MNHRQKKLKSKLKDFDSLSERKERAANHFPIKLRLYLKPILPILVKPQHLNLRQSYLNLLPWMTRRHRRVMK